MKVLVDTGAQHCFINRASDGINSIKVAGVVQFEFSIGGVNTSIPAFITTNLCTDIILGMDYLLKYEFEIYPKKKFITFNFDNRKITISMNPESSSNHHSLQSLNSIQSSLVHQLNTLTMSPFSITQQSILQLIRHVSDPVQHEKLQSLLFKFEFTFDANKLLDAGLVCTSQASYAAPALLVKKKDQSWRLVIDYKKLNSITIKDNYPLPNMEITLQSLGGGYSYFSKFNLKSGFLAISN
ncbi:unnamed protein product [Adineta ricciae]|uniref:Peptidase A2 domain-containing protein n=1 Tax=Adineta ricciae TaxID=249248 RepID=A0A815XXD4_ADIRI|nr:unnamed protein product [Adineta ricciae]